MTNPLPLNAPTRQRPIHPSLPEIRVPASSLSTCLHHPITGEPFTPEQLRRHPLLATLQEKYPTAEAAAKAQEDAVRQLKARLEDIETKSKEVERQMEEKEKVRETERKVLLKSGKGRGAG